MTTMEWLKPRYPEICQYMISRKVVNFRTIPGFEKLIKQFETHVKPKIKHSHCYDNALHAMKFFVKKGFNVQYVEGFAHLGTVIAEHAWNIVTIDGVQYSFDVTASELYSDSDTPFENDYLEFYSCSDLAVLKWYFTHQIPTAVFRKITWIKKNGNPHFQLVLS